MDRKTERAFHCAACARSREQSSPTKPIEQSAKNSHQRLVEGLIELNSPKKPWEADPMRRFRQVTSVRRRSGV